jgi:hypothetical protein
MEPRVPLGYCSPIGGVNPPAAGHRRVHHNNPPMKTFRFSAPLAAASILACGLSSGCRAKLDEPQAQVAQVQPTPAQAVPSVPIARPAQNVPIAVQSVTDQAAASWVAIKDFTFDQRADFIAGAGRLQAMLASQIAELNAKRASMPSTVDTKDWDFAMKEMIDSQSYLKSMVDEAARASPETWAEEKDKVDQAWQRAQEAFDKVKITTTS